MVQLSFSIRVSTAVKSVHVIGSWDKYQRQLPLATDKTDATSRSSWKATLRFHGNLVQPGSRYWYYYLIDGYHCSHNPNEPSTAEPTTGRVLNILDVPMPKGDKSSKKSSSSTKKSSKTSSSPSKKSSKSSDKPSSRRDLAPWSSLSLDIPKGRPLSVSQIKAPKPISPHATRLILDEAFGPESSLDELSMRLGAVNLYDNELEVDEASQPTNYESDSFNDSFDEEDDAELSSPAPVSGYLSGTSSPASSLSCESGSAPRASPCVCERFGVTRAGRRIRLDCRGLRCAGNSDNSDSSSLSGDDSSSSCSSAESDDDEDMSLTAMAAAAAAAQRVVGRKAVSAVNTKLGMDMSAAAAAAVADALVSPMAARRHAIYMH